MGRYGPPPRGGGGIFQNIDPCNRVFLKNIFGRLHDGEYNRESIMNTNNTTKITLNSKLFLGLLVFATTPEGPWN